MKSYHEKSIYHDYENKLQLSGSHTRESGLTWGPQQIKKKKSQTAMETKGFNPFKE